MSTVDCDTLFAYRLIDIFLDFTVDMVIVATKLENFLIVKSHHNSFYHCLNLECGGEKARR